MTMRCSYIGERVEKLPLANFIRSWACQNNFSHRTVDKGHLSSNVEILVIAVLLDGRPVTSRNKVDWESLADGNPPPYRQSLQRAFYGVHQGLKIVKNIGNLNRSSSTRSRLHATAVVESFPQHNCYPSRNVEISESSFTGRPPCTE